MINREERGHSFKRRCQIRFGAGIDLHSNNSLLGISDENDKRHYKQHFPNQEDVILAELEFCRKDLVGIVVEAIFN